MKPDHLVVAVNTYHVRKILLHHYGLLLELVDCALVMNILFWEKQKLHQIANYQTADLVFGETGVSQRPLIKRNSLLLTYVFKF